MPRRDDFPAGTTFVWSMGGIRTGLEASRPPAPKRRRRVPTADPSLDTRRYPRLDLKLPIQYRILGDSRAHVPGPVRPFLLAQSRDASPLGLCLALEEELPSGCVLALNVHLVEEREKFEALARVVWCRPAETPSLHLVGLQFVVVTGERFIEERHARMEAFLRKME